MTTRSNVTGEAEGRRTETLQAKLDELFLSQVQDVRAVDQARSALQKATSRTADTDANADKYEHTCEQLQVGKYETEFAEVRAELEAKKPELQARSWLMDAENGLGQERSRGRNIAHPD